ncbi:hypothetical protein Q5H92_13860 [Hymenobacter sp. M29]|uniref:Uncharacterized protein n=1 Tax=Hymenobacter mellowenesis TaxID=3063995 RepID=A0ABT9AC72_9BACT|nr:hypothetical protein [Hymenobacter sp. M29]MDO7847451.1 hypothetical protein [Hymenobacter sp. M29]
MAKLLLTTFCVLNPDNSFAKTETYFETGQLQRGLSPMSSITSTAISCTYATAYAAGTELERYCAVGSGGVGIMRIVRATADFRNYEFDDVPSTQCDGTCDLMVVDVLATPTSTPSSADGHIRVEVSTSYPPLTGYNPQLGSPTSSTRFSAAGVLPAVYQLDYANVPAGAYAIQLQDNGNCQYTTPTVTVAAGAAPGTGTPGLPSNIDWFKYQMIGSAATVSNGFGATIAVSGYAWNKTTKQGYAVAPIPVNYPDFWDQTVRYAQGAIVKFTRRVLLLNQTDYFRAKSDLVAANFAGTGRIPAPTGNNLSSTYWEPLPIFGKSKLFTVSNIGLRSSAEYDYFYSPPRHPQATALTNYTYYENGAVVRYGWDGFYRARRQLNSKDFADGRIPTPTAGTSDNNWEKINDYAPFYYAIPEAQAIDQYALGALSRRVRYHVYDPTAPNYAPTSTSSLAVAPPGLSPAQGNDFILFDDTTPAQETNLGDLKVIDVIKNDVDNAGQENGSVVILATSPSLPIRFHLRNGVRTGYVQDNTTGVYENLHAGHFVVDTYDANDRYTTVEFDIEDRYRVRWQLTFDDVQGQPLEIQLLERDWTGNVTDVCGTGSPVELSWDTGGEPGGYLPEAVGANLRFEVLTSVAQQFVDTASQDDRRHRVDYYRDGALQFRGYIDATTYREALLGAGQKVTLLATDGLGQLKSTKFVNHQRDRQTARTSMLSILLKCLSFCDVNLPLISGNNLRDRLMTADGEPLLEAFVHRNAYDKKDGKVIADEDIIDCRTVVNAILRVFHALLFQADGCWKIIALNEVHDPFAVRVFTPAGRLVTGTELTASGIDTVAPPLRILESQFATADRELYWIGGTQTRNTIAAAQLLKATVALKLEANLLRNGDFTQWNGANTVPLYWSVQGNPAVTRAKGEKAKEYAVLFANYTTTLTPNNYLISPAAPHLTGQDEDGLVLKFKALLEPTTQNPNELTATVNVQVVCDGTPYGQPFPLLVSSKDKWKEYTLPLPLGLPGTAVRVRVIAPVATDAASVATTLKLNYVALSIQPGLVDWSDLKEDFKEVENDASVITGIRLDDVELTHADLPLLPNAAGNPLPAKKMDVYAWRHAVSLEDFSATTAWKRPNYPATAPLLDNAAQDRMALRAAPATEVSGEVAGPGIDFLRIGLMLDMPEDLDGRFIVLSCFKNERRGTAQITVRKLADGDYGGAFPPTPDEARIATKNGKLGYRISFDNGVEGFRIATP